MKHGFNHIDEEAMEKLESIGIRYAKEDTMWSVWTHRIDHTIDNLLERDLSIEGKDTTKEYMAQNDRVWKHQDSGRYYYLWNDVVFVMIKDIRHDHRFSPPTVLESSVLHLVSPDNQESMRERMLSIPPNANILDGGVLI